jgi:hypothetical protein
VAEDGLKNLLRGNTDVGRWLLTFALQEKTTPKTLAYALVGQIPGLPLLRTAYRTLKNR